MKTRDTDILIIGAGMVGAAFASALLHENSTDLKVEMIEPARIRADEAAYQPGFDIRSTAVSAGTVEWFRQLGLWHQMQERAAAIHHIHVSDQGRFGATRLDRAELSVEALGHVVENPWAGRVFNRHLLSLDNFTLQDECAVSGLQPRSDGVTALVTASDGSAHQVNAALVVVAEGGRSGLASKLGIARESRPYEQVAVIANVVTEKPHQNRAWERFTEKGPLALLPLMSHERQNRLALIWTHPADAGDAVMQLDDSGFLHRLQKDFGYRLGRFLKVGQRQSYPLSLVTATEQVRPGIVLLGNSAHTLHPVAGQGFNLALREALSLAEILREGKKAGKVISDQELLNDYLDTISNDQFRTIGFSHQLTRLFSSPGAAQRLLRRAGLFAVDLVPELRLLLARQAMGINGRKARLSA